MAMVNAAGWRVERIPVTGADGMPSHDALRVSWHGYWQADCGSSAEVAEHVDLATLVPDSWTRARPVSVSVMDARRESGARFPHGQSS